MVDKASKEVSVSQKDNKGITVKKAENLPDWYFEVVQKAEFADYSPVKGFMVIRPNAYSIWEKIQENFNKTLKKLNVDNAYFPLLIPESFFKKEAEHAEGFAPELAYIEKNVDDTEERLAIRPTSETIMYDSYSKWIRSWRDLPLKINQWCNVVRWEVKQTKPFLRTREFLWQEGHNVFETEKEVIADVEKMIKEYKKLIEGLLAVPVMIGKKSEGEKFAGAVTTMTAESLMPDGKALQCGTSHNLGQNFSKSFGIKFLDKNEKESFGWQNSWGFSTRLIGATIMLHGDDKGMIIPPKVAKNKAVIVPILFEATKEKVLEKAREIEKEFSSLGFFIDGREEYNAGWKYNEWELKGIPLRIEIGPKDLEKKQVVVVRRDTGVKEFIPEKELSVRIPLILEDIQDALFKKAQKAMYENIVEANDLSDLKKKLNEGKMVRVFMKNSKDVEEKLKEKISATSRFIEDSKIEGVCVITGEKTKTVGYVARSY